MANHSLSRRRLLASCAAFAAGASQSAPLVLARERQRLRVGVIGIGVRGKYLIGNLPDTAHVTAICDCSGMRLDSAMRPQGTFVEVLERFRLDAPKVRQYHDYRQMIEREPLDAVIIATPDHHHALAAVLALDKGLHVYLEKPLTICIGEGRLLADRVRKTGLVLQVGSQQRTMKMNRFGCEFLRDGGIGKISKVELTNYPGPIARPEFAAQPIPDGMKWDLFLGPAQQRPYHRQLWMKEDFKVGSLLWRGWDLFRDYSGHIMTNWGAHSVDMAQYALGRDNTGPVSITAKPLDSVRELGQQWSHKTPAPAADAHRFWPVTMRYEDGVELHFNRPHGDLRFHGEHGVARMRRNHFEVDPPARLNPKPDPGWKKAWAGSGHVARPHLQNWLDSISIGAALNAPVEVGHRTVTICHLANLARELKRELTWDPKREQFVDDDEANALLMRPRRAGFELPS